MYVSNHYLTRQFYKVHHQSKRGIDTLMNGPDKARVRVSMSLAGHWTTNDNNIHDLACSGRGRKSQDRYESWNRSWSEFEHALELAVAAGTGSCFLWLEINRRLNETRREEIGGDWAWLCSDFRSDQKRTETCGGWGSNVIMVQTRPWLSLGEINGSDKTTVSLGGNVDFVQTQSCLIVISHVVCKLFSFRFMSELRIRNDSRLKTTMGLLNACLLGF